MYNGCYPYIQDTINLMHRHCNVRNDLQIYINKDHTGIFAIGPLSRIGLVLPLHSVQRVGWLLHLMHPGTNMVLGMQGWLHDPAASLKYPSLHSQVPMVGQSMTTLCTPTVSVTFVANTIDSHFCAIIHYYFCISSILMQNSHPHKINICLHCKFSNEFHEYQCIASKSHRNLYSH